MKKLLFIIIIFPLLGKVSVDSNLPRYNPVVGITGKINSIGSDTLNNVMTLFAEHFKRVYPNVTIQIEGKGSSTAPPALISGTAQLAPMSREMKSSEIDAFEKKFGYKPTKIAVAIDALAVYVHKDNKLKGLTLKQVDSIFSSTYKQGGSNISEWTYLNENPLFFGEEITIYGRNSASGTYSYFKKVALKKGNLKKNVNEQPGSSSVVSSIAQNLFGIGYSGVGYITSGVRLVPLAKGDGEYYEPNVTNCLNGNYPLARLLYVYVNKKPYKPMSKLVEEFLKFILSKKGQELVVKDGYFPLTAESVSSYRKIIR